MIYEHEQFQTQADLEINRTGYAPQWHFFSFFGFQLIKQRIFPWSACGHVQRDGYSCWAEEGLWPSRGWIGLPLPSPICLSKEVKNAKTLSFAGGCVILDVFPAV
jgi:hypothetical protein